MAGAAVVILLIDAAGKLVDPSPIRAEPGTHVGFVLVSDHATDKFDIKIDFDDIVLKHDKTKKDNPFVKSGTLNKQVKPGEIDLIQQQMKDANDFVPIGSLPYTTYKYTVVVNNLTTHLSTSYDPDIDVPPA
jgi:hypothetical protein